jgi:hypothetical protein
VTKRTVNAEAFAKAWKDEMGVYLNDEYLTMKASMLGLNDSDIQRFKPMIEEVLGDAFYTLLLGLDGAASIGGIQVDYEIKNESGELIVGGKGDLEAIAWRFFRSEHG